MKKNYKLQNTNYKLQITKVVVPAVLSLLGIKNYNDLNYKGNGVFGVDQALNQLIINSKGSHGLHKDSFRLQTMTALIKSFCGGSRGAVFSKRAPLAAGGKKRSKS